jgi:hypothetical protein
LNERKEFALRKAIDITGETFGKLTVIKRAERRSTSRNIIWLCRCSCGKLTEADSYSLRHGVVKSCGCLRQEISAINIRKNCKTRRNIGNTKSFKDDLGNPIQTIKIGGRNKSGYIGVSFDSKHERWIARLMLQGRYVLNRAFVNFNDAVEARKQAEKKYLKQ